jgi:ADP-heptose:LPS heptosyltransferase
MILVTGGGSAALKRIVTNCHGGKEEIVYHYGVSAEKMRVVHNGTDAEALEETYPGRTIGFLTSPAGRVHTQKARLRLDLSGEGRRRALRFREARRIAPGLRLVGLHPGAQKSYKCWSVKNFAVLGTLLEEKLACRIVIAGDAREKPLAAELTSRTDRVFSSAGQLSLCETAARIERMEFFIANYTGPMHMSSALRTPTIALFCPTDRVLCGPYQNERYRVISQSKTCFPCGGKEINRPVCPEQMRPKELMAAGERILQEGGEG